MKLHCTCGEGGREREGVMRLLEKLHKKHKCVAKYFKLFVLFYERKKIVKRALREVKNVIHLVFFMLEGNGRE